MTSPIPRSVCALALATLVALAALPAQAITTDRPDAAESAWTVGFLRFQLETGVDVAFDAVDQTDATTITLPTKFRFGVLDFLEIHVQGDAFVHHRTTPEGGATASDTDVADLGFGFKVHGLDGDGLVPAVGLVATVTAPIGRGVATDDAWLLTPIFAAEWGLPFGFGFAANLGFTVPLSDRERVGDTVLYAVSLGRSLAPFADMVGLFVQFYGESPIDEGDTLLHVGGGVTLSVLENLQFDVYVNGGVTEAAPDVAVGAGLAVRL